MIVLVVLTALRSPTLLQVGRYENVAIAFIARVYTKPGDKRKSHPVVYLCGLHGENRQGIARSDSDRLESVEWRDRNHLDWIEDRPGTDVTFNVIELDLATGMVRSRGVVGRERLYKSKHGFVVYDAGSNKVGTIVMPRSKEHGGNLPSFAVTGDAYTVTVESGSKKTSFPLSTLGSVGFQPAKDGRNLWIAEYEHDSTYRNHYSLSRFDVSTDESTPLIEEAQEFDFSPNRAVYGAVATRSLGPYSKGKDVWIAKAWAGNWTTGAKWPIADGLVYATSIAIRSATK